MAITAKISIIIPVLNELENINKVLDQVPTSPDIETIIVDGGSIDGTLELVQSLGIKVLSSSPGRANQMNMGAKIATGEILLFLHGDTILPAEFDRLIRAALNTARKAPMAGAFALQIDSPLSSLRLIEWAVSWRSRWFQMPYGDQAIFLTADTFHQIGGFAKLPIMEDFELIRRLKKLGQIAFIPIPVVTSARRWLNQGIIKTTLINQMIVCAYLLGVAPERLVGWYRDSQKFNPQIKLLITSILVMMLIPAGTYFKLQELLHTSLIWIESFGTFEPIVFILIYNVATIMFVPGVLLTMSGGVLFGIGWGSIYVIIAATLGATGAFLIGRYLCRELFCRMIEGYPKFQAIDTAVAKDGFKIVLLTRLSPILPFNLLNYAFGVTQVSLKDYMLGSLGIIPGSVMYVYLGALVGDVAMLGKSDVLVSSEAQIAQWVIRGVGLIATLAMTIYLARLAKQALDTTI